MTGSTESEHAQSTRARQQEAVIGRSAHGPVHETKASKAEPVFD